MTKIIGLVQVKGGAGRSTVSTNLAGELSKAGKTVLIDCDMPQGTSASWFAVRQQKGRQGNLKADTAIDHSDLINKVKQHQDADYIVLDGAPRLAQELSGLASQELGIEALTSSTGMRVAYMQALGEGLTVAELADTSAKDEVKALTGGGGTGA